MRCPKCHFITYEGHRTCPRCGADLSSISESLGPFYEPHFPEDLILTDTLLTPPPFIQSPENLPSVESPSEEETSEKETFSVAGPSVEDEILKELEEALQEETS